MATIPKMFYYLFHLGELRSIIQWKTWHEPVHQRNWADERVSLYQCFHYLELTSRSFSAVICELHPELLVPVALFYLILRGLDTIEDDMTIPLEEKDRLLRDFHNILEKKGWTFDGNRPDEKDRDLLVHFDVVTEEFTRVKPVYQHIIKDITRRMGSGMAEYANNAEHNANGIDSIKDYDLYCHFVAGLVGEGLTRLFVESDLAKPALLERPHLQESMGLFLQKTNIIRDVREDWDDKRRFWPKEIWSKYVDKFEDLFDKANQEAALNCSSEMVLNALSHADECLFYLAGIKEQSVFNFTAIPQTMAIATLAKVFRNPLIFHQNVKITKGQTCQLMIESSQNLPILYNAFRKCVRDIHRKNTPNDPNFLKISVACGKIEQFIESVFPSQNPEELARKARGENVDEKKAKDAEARKDMMYIMGAMLMVLIALTSIMLTIAYLAGARFDIALDRLRQGKFSRPNVDEAQKLREQFDHIEL
ncbi:MAG: bifunctional farnesyl-diphosphate farnesyltransferase/squalene synthase [Watsoniomyces obsoletus]|nr:MAG: bifunctional farnesyl-diphosphate farnesyltransferase/squalene synthase [Watsoniomyces obsoletus]